jgi:excisionase family DNA binding protein
MDEIKLHIDLAQLEPLIRKVISETIARMEAGSMRLASGSAERTDVSSANLLWKRSQAAKALGISERTLWSLTQAGTIPYVKIGRSVRYAPDELKAWVSAQKSMEESC